MLGISDQALATWVNDPIEQFERDLTDQDRESVADLADVDCTITSLDGQSAGTIHRQGDCSPRPRV